MRCTTVNQTRELLSANMHFQLQKLVQFCFCLCRTAMRLCQCCIAATTCLLATENAALFKFAMSSAPQGAEIISA